MTANLNMSILVVDDSPTTIRITRDTLRNLGYDNVDTANGCNSALEKMRIKAYGLVISDWTKIWRPMTLRTSTFEARAMYSAWVRPPSS